MTEEIKNVYPKIPDPVFLTEKAAEKVKEVMKSEGLDKSYLRVGVIGGGCSGLSYNLDFATEPYDTDHVYTQHGVQVIIDPISSGHLMGTTIEWQDSLMGAGFKFINPNSVKSCGCGSSFAV